MPARSGSTPSCFPASPTGTSCAPFLPSRLTEEEKAFLNGPTNELCRMVNDWTIRHNDKEIPEEVWDFAKKNGFLGMLISKEHGGLGFSAQAQSLILGRIASRSPDVCTIVMVPNSLGPGELIEKYGTPEQKEHYLPRCECFALVIQNTHYVQQALKIVVLSTFAEQSNLSARHMW